MKRFVALIVCLLSISALLAGCGGGRYETLVMDDASMQPTIQPMEIVYADTNVAADKLKVGDIIVYKKGNFELEEVGSNYTLTISRLVEINGSQLVVKGDSSDSEKITIPLSAYHSKAIKVKGEGGRVTKFE